MAPLTGNGSQQAPTSMSSLARVMAIIPVRDEASTIGAVVAQLRGLGVGAIRVVDNGSTDASAAQAHSAGAEVVREPRAGYGRACWRGLQQLPDSVGWILFCDGDGSDDLAAVAAWRPLMNTADLILGNRCATAEGRARLTAVQRFGNRFATSLIRLGWGHAYADLGPLRLIRRESLEAMAMADRGFGWTIEMQVKAIEAGLRIVECGVAVHRRRGGRSKISGTLRGSVGAAVGILTTVGRLYGRRLELLP